MESALITRMQIVKITDSKVMDLDDHLVVEEPLQIELEYGSAMKRKHKNISVTMRTPGHDAELATGFLFTEGIIKTKYDILKFDPEAQDLNRIKIALREDIEPELQQAERIFFSNSSCGVCGKSDIRSIKTESIYKCEKDQLFLDTGYFYQICKKLSEQQAVFDCTGGLHASALFDRQGNFVSLFEDVGRHNALDKLIGSCLLKELLPLSNLILLLSGRASFELVQKANIAAIKIIAAVGAPSSLAVELAKECGITLIGFLRSGHFNIYSGKQRILF